MRKLIDNKVFKIYSSRISDSNPNGEIGEIINIQTTEHVSYHHLSTSYVRGKWANSKKCHTTMLLANRINHPTKEMHKLFARSLFELIFPEESEVTAQNSSGHCHPERAKRRNPQGSTMLRLSKRDTSLL